MPDCSRLQQLIIEIKSLKQQLDLGNQVIDDPEFEGRGHSSYLAGLFIKKFGRVPTVHWSRGLKKISLQGIQPKAPNFTWGYGYRSGVSI